MAGALTKRLGREVLPAHMVGTGQLIQGGRHNLMPEVDQGANGLSDGQFDLEDDWESNGQVDNIGAGLLSILFHLLNDLTVQFLLFCPLYFLTIFVSGFFLVY